jgi:predicted esterase/tetratricopeptide (TPR) repeat protein
MRHALFTLTLFLLSSAAFCQNTDSMARLQSLYQSGKYDEAIGIARDLLAAQPGGSEMLYTLACLYSLTDQPDSACAALGRSIQNGWTDYLFFGFDSDLDKIRNLPRYSELMSEARQAALKQNREKALDVTEGQWTTLTLKGESELPRVDMAMSYDNRELRIKATVHDAHFKDGDRSWRYGDGFIINFAAPETFDSVYTDRFHAFGFSLEKGKTTAVLVNRDGTYILNTDETMLPQITVDMAQHQADYEITIPWAKVYPFHPLLDSLAGINVKYTSQADDGSQKSLIYVPSFMFDTEQSSLRRFVPLRFHPAANSPLFLTGRFKTRLISGSTAEAKLVIWSPADAHVTLSATLKDSADRAVSSARFAADLKPGRNTIERSINVPVADQSCRCVFALGDSLICEERIYRYDSQALLLHERSFSGPNAANENAATINSRDALRFRLGTLKSEIAAFSPRSRLVSIQKDIEDLNRLADLYQAKRSVYAQGGYLLSAFRSPADSTLQPFSIVLPEGFDPEKTYPLLVALHGSGVDEVSFAQSAGQSPNWKDYIVLAPRGRSLSGWYLGQDERDLVDLIALTKRMFHVDRTLCYGFSMGGYGVWRMTLLHPDLFDGAICVSGGTSAWVGNREQTDVRGHIAEGSKLKYLVIHGTEDRALPIADTDSLVSTLKDKGYDVTYIRVPGGGHGDFSTRDMVKEWLKDTFKDTSSRVH